MLYIRLNENNKKECKNIERIKFLFKSKIRINTNIIDNVSIISIDSLSKSVLKKVKRYLTLNCINTVVLSDNLIYESNLNEILDENNIKILNGKWILKYLLKNIVKFIGKKKGNSIYREEVAVLVNEIDEEIYESIKELSKELKFLNIISNNKNNEFILKKLERDVFENSGIILNTNKNYKKSLQKITILINIDFSEEEINKFSFPRKLCLINLNKDVKIKDKCFSGIILNKFDLKLPVKYFEKIILLKEFNSLSLYESFIYKNTSPLNILSEIDKDDVIINTSEGKRGKIDSSEYIYLIKK